MGNELLVPPSKFASLPTNPHHEAPNSVQHRRFGCGDRRCMLERTIIRATPRKLYMLLVEQGLFTVLSGGILVTICHWGTDYGVSYTEGVRDSRQRCEGETGSGR